jgi:4-hydroxybenzoate polyprenyltransferase
MSQFIRSPALTPARSPINVTRSIQHPLELVRSFIWELYLLELFGALATTVLGSASARLLDVQVTKIWPFWFFSYLAVYNLDRLYADPADLINTPLRMAWRERLRPKRWILSGVAVLALTIWAVLSAGTAIMAIALGGILVLWFYSRPLPGLNFRLKDSLLFKSVGVPLAISISLVCFPLAIAGKLGYRPTNFLVFLWCFVLLFTNGFIFDIRDRVGDLAQGTRTLPIALGQRGSELASLLLGVCLVWLTLLLPPGPIRNWPLAAWLCSIYVVLLSVLWRRQISALTLSFCADLLLVAPALYLFVRR